MTKWIFGFTCWLLIIASVSCNSNEDPVRQNDQAEYHEIKVMTFNILYTTDNESTLKVLQEADADIIGVQETSPGRLRDLAQKLRYHYLSFKKTTANMSDQDTGILSRFPITRFLTNGVVVKVNPSLQVAVFSVHLSPYPYEPYDFRDGFISTAAQAVASATAVRIPEIDPVLLEIADLQQEGIPVFLTGDFNEPSHLDWTAGTASKNLHFGKIVEWPVSKKVLQLGMIDAYRNKLPDPANFPGNTWTTWEAADEVYDRIDIIYHTPSPAYTLTDIRLVGGTSDLAAGIKVENYGSDHYGVIATYNLGL
ncbi:MAG: endonuclease/exonuclease/phosphatase family protein [Bacteroidota bacterium]